MKSSLLPIGRIVWSFTAIVLATVTYVVFAGPLESELWVRPNALFGIVTIASMAGVIAATVVMGLADRRDLAEHGLLGAGLMSASIMPMVHGLTTPDVLFGDTPAFRASVFLTLPIAVAVAMPLVLHHTGFGRWAARNWRDWSLLSILAVFSFASVMLYFPDLVASPGPRHPLTIVTSLGIVIALVVLSLRQIRFYELGHRPPNLIAGVSLVTVSVTALLPLTGATYTAGAWWLHIAGAIGVLGACLGMVASKHTSPFAKDVLAPVIARDPLAAFELGLSPIVHDYVSSLELLDPITRDHVVRTSELAMRVGERFNLPARTLRDLGLAAMLHDIGKLELPVEVLHQPRRLTIAEFETIKTHPEIGERMLLAEPTLASAAPFVRSHHERVDGHGYPDGLSGTEIPLPSRIIAVCDALDAMTHDRDYRPRMTTEVAIAILREHAGSQWDNDVINKVLTVLPSLPDAVTLDDVGRGLTEHQLGSTMPDDIGELLERVDIEI